MVPARKRKAKPAPGISESRVQKDTTNSRHKACNLAFTMMLAFVLCMPAGAQQLADLALNGQTGGAPAPQNATGADDDSWHLGIIPYLWFAGVHGTVGALDRTVGIHASAGDVLSKFNIGFMGAVEARKKRFLLPVDFMWIKLSDDQGLPLSSFPGITSIKVKVTQTVPTPKAGYRVVDHEKLQADAVVGIRYWHLGQNLSLQPSGLLSNSSQSANWVDVVAGAKFIMPLSRRAVITVLGDAGAGGANLDYQVAGLLGYKIKPTVILQVGWRYLDVNYRPNGTFRFVYDAAQSGLFWVLPSMSNDPCCTSTPTIPFWRSKGRELFETVKSWVSC